MRELPSHRGRQPRGDQLKRERRPTGDGAVVVGQAALCGPVQAVAEPLPLIREVPGDEIAGDPMRCLLCGDRLRKVVGDDMGRVVVGERHLTTRRRQRDIRAALGPARTVVLIERLVDRGLVLESPGRHGERATENPWLTRHRLQMRRVALRLPVTRATQLGLQRTHQSHRVRQRGVIRGRLLSWQGRCRHSGDC